EGDAGETFTISGDVLRVLIAKLAYHNKESYKGEAAHVGPGGYGARNALGWKELYHTGPNQGHLKKVPKDGTRELARVALMAAVVDEIAFHDNHRPEGVALLTFAEALGIDIEHVRREADWDMLTPKQQQERIK